MREHVIATIWPDCSAGCDLTCQKKARMDWAAVAFCRLSAQADQFPAPTVRAMSTRSMI